MQYKFQYPDGLTQYRAVTDMDWSHHSSEILVVSYTAVPKPILEELDTRVGGGGWVAISVPVVRLIFPWRLVIVDCHLWRAVLECPNVGELTWLAFRSMSHCRVCTALMGLSWSGPSRTTWYVWLGRDRLCFVALGLLVPHSCLNLGHRSRLLLVPHSCLNLGHRGWL